MYPQCIAARSLIYLLPSLLLQTTNKKQHYGILQFTTFCVFKIPAPQKLDGPDTTLFNFINSYWYAMRILPSRFQDKSKQESPPTLWKRVNQSRQWVNGSWASGVMGHNCLLRSILLVARYPNSASPRFSDIPHAWTVLQLKPPTMQTTQAK